MKQLSALSFATLFTLANAPVFEAKAEDTPQEVLPSQAEVLGRSMLEKVNAEREKAQLPALEWSPTLASIAFAHSKDMFMSQNFSHINSAGEEPGDRAKKGGYPYMMGENLAMDGSVEAAHRGLMESPGHKANILDSDWNEMAVGIYQDGSQLYITQLFGKRVDAVKSVKSPTRDRVKEMIGDVLGEDDIVLPE